MSEGKLSSSEVGVAHADVGGQGVEFGARSCSRLRVSAASPYPDHAQRCVTRREVVEVKSRAA